MSEDIDNVIAYARATIESTGGLPIELAASSLLALLDDYERLRQAERARSESARARGRKGGRPATDTPAPSTIRARKTRARQKAEKEIPEQGTPAPGKSQDAN